MKKLLSLILVVCLVMGIVPVVLSEDAIQPSITWFTLSLSPYEELTFDGTVQDVSVVLTDIGETAFPAQGYAYEWAFTGTSDKAILPGNYSVTVNYQVQERQIKHV